ncbi:unnamed protein product [Somion occarium]|uniref:Uncharacterized protein n=1 Tax=Somion occarium TaxID=3059160 RepID=A0ABP1DKG6_9APHY
MSKQIAVVWPAHYEDARVYLWGFGLYAAGTAALGIIQPQTVLKMLGPALYAAEKYLGVPPTHAPITVEEWKANAFAYAFTIAIGAIYTILGGPFWNRGGKVFLEAGLFTRIIFISVVYTLCFLTPYGSSLGFVIATNDLIAVFLTKRALKASWGDLVHGRKVKQVVIDGSAE